MSFLGNYFSSCTPEIRSTFKKYTSDKYHSLILELGYKDFKTFFALDFYVQDLKFSIDKLEKIIKKLESPDTQIYFEGNSLFFFRPEFRLNKENDYFVLRPLSLRNRSLEIFEFRFPISKLQNLIDVLKMATKELKSLKDF
jgi:hypothetical protein